MQVVITLDLNDVDALRDVLYNAKDIEATTEDALLLWEELPEDIKLEAVRWGVSDTVVRDNIYEWIQKNKI